MTHPAPPPSPRQHQQEDGSNDESDGGNDDEDGWNVNNESEDSDDGGVLLESDVGWIDDTPLAEEVAGQVTASSAYGMMKLEDEARRRKGRTSRIRKTRRARARRWTLGDDETGGNDSMVKKSLLKIKTTTTAGDNYNHYGVSAGDGEAEAGEEGAYGNARGRSQQQAMTVAAAKVWIKGWERAKGLATKVGRGWSTASYRWSSIMGAEAKGLAASMSSSLTDVEMLEDDTTTKCDDGTDDLARG
eukprot:CAMPEP_0181099210 /NCGR_PEP_ID=MMETSP1071-20121207/12539_1 /TAXON_ID=35127 /ORGANISM="Thalassiosira sp., Strain NH16" /LENGTH=244 /DNA_ID=CAMNT_0023181859 /DNA_START=265 /DNA_END=1003 /DNA_ORIENTATION=+